MAPRAFLDTNVLLYSAVEHPGEKAKIQRAKDIVGSVPGAVSVQVLQEFYTQAIRRTRPVPLDREGALAAVDAFVMEMPVQPMTLEIFRAAQRTHDRFQINYWDAAILEAARALGCKKVLTEDLNDGQDYDGVRVENPFRDC